MANGQVSWSEVKLFRKCMKAHDFKYHQKLKKKRRAIPLIKGNILHEMLHSFTTHKRLKDYIGPDPWEILDKYEEDYRELFAEEREEHGDIIGDCGKVFESYLRTYRRDPYTYEESESFVATDFMDGIRLIGYIDRVAIDKEERRWLMDSKFNKNMPSIKVQIYEMQLLLYYWIWNRCYPDKPLAGIIWDYSRSRPPIEPEVLKKGGLSQRKNMVTDGHTYMAAIGREGLDPADYTEMLQHLQGNEEQFHRRSILPAPSKTLVDNVLNDFRTTTAMIQKMKGIAPRTGLNQFNCGGCEFKDLCQAELRGQDGEFIKKSDFIQRKDHEDLADGDENSEED